MGLKADQGVSAVTARVEQRLAVTRKLKGLTKRRSSGACAGSELGAECPSVVPTKQRRTLRPEARREPIGST
jgi:hypothetical protein